MIDNKAGQLLAWARTQKDMVKITTEYGYRFPDVREKPFGIDFQVVDWPKCVQGSLVVGNLPNRKQFCLWLEIGGCIWQLAFIKHEWQARVIAGLLRGTKL